MEYWIIAKTKSVLRVENLILILALICQLFILTRCTPISSLNNSINSTGTSVTVTATASPSASATAGGAMSARIIFTQSSGGSFTVSPAVGGTLAAVGGGLLANQVFNPDGTLLATGGNTATNWPSWLTSFEVGISGPLNSAATATNCANFASSTESSQTNCVIAGVSTTCGATAGDFRVSEADCTAATTTTGTGGPNDGIYMRAIFNRTALGSSENMLAVLQYSASAINPGPVLPTTCFSSGSFAPEGCSDFAWQAYIKHSAYDINPLPFMLIVPPMVSTILPGNTTPSSNPSTKQIIIPLAGDPALTVLQISRKSVGNINGITTYCQTNSPFCAGMVFYTLTFYRI